MPHYDVIVIGGGHNGLVAAAYLAKAGRRVCVLERREVLGGCASTEEPWAQLPGVKVSPAAYVISLFLPAIIEELKLGENGLTVLPRQPSSFTPTLDGRSLVLGADMAANQRSIAQFSEHDAAAYAQYDAMLTRIAEAIEPTVMAPPELGGAIRAAWALGRDLPRAMMLAVGAARPMLERWFESEPLRATLATDAVIGAWCAPSSPGSAYVLLHHVMGEAGGARGVWGYVRGGMGGLADALERTCRALRVDVRREAAVESIVVDEGRVRGVRTADGDTIEAAVVLSSIDATATMLRLVGERHLPERYAGRVRSIDYQSGSAKVNLALDGLPDFNTGELPPQVALRGTTHLCPDLAFIERAFDDAKAGRVSDEPIVEITVPSTVDDTLAPPSGGGRHVMGVFVQYVPYATTDRALVLDRVLRVIERYAPNIRRIVRASQVLLPHDLEERYGLTGGNIFQGAMTLGQLGPLRAAGWGYRTPVKGLYLCGAATHPGGGVMGACGRNAAEAVIADQRT